MPQQKPEPNTSHQDEFGEPKKPSVGKIVLFIVLAIIVFAAAVSGTYYYMNKKLTEQKKAQQAQIDALNAKLAELQNSQTTTTTPTDPTAGWSSYTLKREKLSFNYPSNWKLEESYWDKGKAYGQNVATYDLDLVTLVSPAGFRLNISNITDTTSTTERIKSQGCPVSRDTCTNYSADPVQLLGKTLYITTTGYISNNGVNNTQNGSESYKLGLASNPNCVIYCSVGIGKAKNLEGVMSVIGIYLEKQFTSGQQFNNDTDVQTAKQIIKTLHY